MMDGNGSIRFSKVMELCFLCSDHEVVDNGAFGPERPPFGL